MPSQLWNSVFGRTYSQAAFNPGRIDGSSSAEQCRSLPRLKGKSKPKRAVGNVSHSEAAMFVPTSLAMSSTIKWARSIAMVYALWQHRCASRIQSSLTTTRKLTTKRTCIRRVLMYMPTVFKKTGVPVLFPRRTVRSPYCGFYGMSPTGVCDDKLPAAGSSRVSVTKSNASATVEDSTSRPQTANSAEDTAPTKATTESEFPEGGPTAWLTVLGAFFVQACAFGYTTSFGVYQDFYARTYLSNESSSAISWIGSINAFLVIASGLFVGPLYDRGYFYYLLYGGSILLAFSLFMLSLAKPDAFYQILLSQGIGAGLGAGMLYLPSISVVSHYFRRRRALAMTMVSSGSSIGAVVHPVMLNNLLNNPSIGFATAARANAGLIAGLLLVSCLLMRSRLAPPKKSVHLWTVAKRFAKDKPYVFAALGMALFIIGFYFPLFYLQLDAVRHGVDETFAFYSLVILNACSFFGRLAPGVVANRVGSGNIVVVFTFICAVTIFGLIGLGSVASVVVIAVIYGLASGVYITMLAPFLATLTDDFSELGARMGLAFFGCGVGSLIGTPISGALLTSDYIWWRPAVFSGIMAFAGWCCYLTSVILHRRREQRQRRDDSFNEKA
ncbi:major facilitator superfamily domain-containing protein [Cerioporus squamosus]|nr:major facilitator superfamily domain-containing protein [Cerioporus squamosus]